MSQVKDSEGNVINRPPVQFLDGNGNVKYSGEHADTLDWFDSHPEDRPIEVVRVVENGTPVVKMAESDFHSLLAETAMTGIEIGKQQASLPSAADLDAVVAEQEIAQAQPQESAVKEESNVQSSNDSSETGDGSLSPSVSPSSDVLGG